MSDHTPSQTPFKTCSKCGQSKLRNEFARQATHCDGLRSQCRACQKEYRQQYYADNRDKDNERRRRRATTRRDHNCERNRIWRKANPERVKEIKRRFRENHSEREAQRKRLWKSNNPDKVKAQQHLRRARQMQSEGSFTATDIDVQRERQRGKCYYCGKKRKLTIEHIVPLARGGSNEASNVVLACGFCNSSKGGKLPHEWPSGGKLL